MSCYFRNKGVKAIFEAVGLQVTPEKKKEIDRRFHQIVGVEYKDCSAIWPKVKTLEEEPSLRKKIVSELKKK